MNMSDSFQDEIIKECKRQEESCLYTSTSLYCWLRSLRRWNRVLVVAPIILGGVASWNILDSYNTNPWIMWGAAVAALLAGLLPTIFKTLGLDGHIDYISDQAAMYKNLQDRFRQLGNFAVHKTKEELKREFDDLMQKMEEARNKSITAPERFFKAAQKKIKGGDYTFDSDSQ